MKWRVTGTGWGTINLDRLAHEGISAEMTFEKRCEQQDKGSHARRERVRPAYRVERSNCDQSREIKGEEVGVAAKEEAGLLLVLL